MIDGLSQLLCWASAWAPIREATPIRQFSIAAALGTPELVKPHNAYLHLPLSLQRVFCPSLASRNPISCAHASAALNVQLTTPDSGRCLAVHNGR